MECNKRLPSDITKKTREAVDMGAPRKLPDLDTLMQWQRQGLTHQQIADRATVLAGEPVGRAAVSVALHRAGKTTDKARHTETIPWRVRTEHSKERQAVYLRWLGRRRAGLSLSQRQNDQLDNWLARLERDKLVVAYDPGSEYGFYYVKKRPRIDGRDGVPIRHGQWSLDGDGQ
jgi:hypothetical protein